METQNALNTQQVIDQFNQYVISNYGRLPVVISRARGSRMWDLDGKEYLDMFPGWAVSGLGHCHPHVVRAIQSQAEQLIHIDNTFYSLPQGKLAEMLSTRSFSGKCFFCNSGAESVEAALKLARLHAGEGKYKVISMERSFHGRTFAAMTATGQAKTHAGFSPLLAGFMYAPFNDLEAVRSMWDDQVGAVIVEPVQGEGGVRVADKEFLQGLRDLCDEHGAVLIFDEVQTGMGRTGTWFGYQQFGVEPDVITLAKALGGGVSIGAIIAQANVADSLKPGTHASTFGGNPLAAAAAVAVIEAIEQDNLLEHTNAMARYTADKLGQLQQRHSIIREIRQLGLMIGIELDMPGADVVDQAMSRGLRVNCTQQTVLRMTPAMTVTTDELDRAIALLDECLAAVQSGGQ